MPGHMVNRHVERNFQRATRLGGFGQKQSTLDRAKQRKSQVVRIGGGAKFAALLHPGEPIFEAVAPH